ncbi:MAG: DUF5677 domain-containing protein [Pseudomonadota bacterium]
MTYLRNRARQEEIFNGVLDLSVEVYDHYLRALDSLATRDLVDLQTQVLAGLLHRGADLHATVFACGRREAFQTAARMGLRALSELCAEVGYLLANNVDEKCRTFVRHQLGKDQKLQEAVCRNERGHPQSQIGRRIENSILGKREEASHGEDFRAPPLGAHWSGLSAERLFEEAGLARFYGFTYVPMSGYVHSSWDDIIKNRFEAYVEPPRLRVRVAEMVCPQILEASVFCSLWLLERLLPALRLGPFPQFRSHEDITTDLHHWIEVHEVELAAESEE